LTGRHCGFEDCLLKDYQHRVEYITKFNLNGDPNTNIDILNTSINVRRDQLADIAEEMKLHVEKQQQVVASHAHYIGILESSVRRCHGRLKALRKGGH